MNETKQDENSHNKRNGLILLIVGLGGLVWIFWDWYNAVWLLKITPWADRWFNLIGAVLLAIWPVMISSFGLVLILRRNKRRKYKAKQSEGVKP